MGNIFSFNTLLKSENSPCGGGGKCFGLRAVLTTIAAISTPYNG
ncbi:hypothetical protein CSC17_0044 [Klebsiella oxytoca]|nr:hypothetical protein CSC17_0044 [Klebsiella oxytoca]EUC83494.1 hypothetical protein HMPREF1570_4299 [Klebsiella oxytoca KA-2]